MFGILRSGECSVNSKSQTTIGIYSIKSLMNKASACMIKHLRFNEILYSPIICCHTMSSPKFSSQNMRPSVFLRWFLVLSHIFENLKAII